MKKDDIQTWLLIIFLIVLVLGLYKVYAIFNTPITGPDTKTQHKQLQNIIEDFLIKLDRTDLNSQELFELLIQNDDLKDETYKNFNLNRLNQVLQQLFFIHGVDSLPDLIIKVQNEA